MKKFILYFCLASGMTLIACSEKNLTENSDGSRQEVLEITAVVPELSIVGDTRSNLDQGTDFSWELNDRLGFIPSPSATHPEYDRQSMFYVKSIGEDGKNAQFVGNGWGMLRGMRYYSYYPYSSENSCSSVYVDYTGQTQATNGGSSHLGAYDYLHSWIDMPKVGEADVSYRRIGCVARIVITVPQCFRAVQFTKMTLTSDENLFLSSGTYNPSREYPVSGDNGQAETVTFATKSMANSFSLNLGTGSGINCDDKGELVLYAMMSPAAWAGKSVSLQLDGLNGTDSSQWNCSLTPSINQIAGACYEYSSAIQEPPTSTDLGADGTANCYIVTKAGKYHFRADVKGNGVPVGYETSSLSVPVCAYLVWESVNTTTAPVRNSIISDVEYKDGYVYFEVPDNGIEGNATIALLNTQSKDSFTANGGKAIWVWHIWRLNSAPGDNDYGNGRVFMDRNLGALNNTPGDGRAIGLLYQWGRPVPMLGAANYSSNNAETLARIVNNTDGSGSSARIPYWAVNGPFSLNDIFGSPLQFMVGVNGNRNWTYEHSLSLWKSTKTQYDPCPPGYKVPDSFAGFSLNGTLSQNGGWIKCGNGPSYWWPIGGLRGLYFTKELTNTGHDSVYWSCEANAHQSLGNVGYGMNFNLNNRSAINARQASYLITGNSVRCQKIQ